MNSRNPSPTGGGAPGAVAADIVRKGLAKRYRREQRFRRYGLGAILVSLCFLAVLFTSIVSKGYSAAATLPTGPALGNGDRAGETTVYPAIGVYSQLFAYSS